MKMHKLISVLLSLVVSMTILLPGSAVFSANTTLNDTGSGKSGNNGDENSQSTAEGMVLNKTVTDKGNGVYNINLEAYATGDKVITTINKDIPTDIVLVLDQSGSMDYTIPTKIDYIPYDNNTTNIQYYRNYADNIYYQLDNGEYAKVNVTWDITFKGIRYSYTYTNEKNVSETKHSYGIDTACEYTFYKKEITYDTRLNVLKSVLNNFVNSVKEKAVGKDGEAGTDDDVNHRIAVVGFGSRNSEGYNTELLSIDGKNSTYDSSNNKIGIRYTQLNDKNYKNAFQNMNTTVGQSMIYNAISALAAEGATRADLGMEMAQKILANNPVEGGEKRNRVVVMFTDGSPTAKNGFHIDVANSAISTSTSIKNSGTTVYTVGIFAGADATSAGSEPKGNLSDDSSSIPAASNWFMQQVSSNNGTPKNPSYYLSAGDAESLNSIFQQISENIESGGSSTTLSSSTVVRDIIAPQFTVPEGAENITISAFDCTGKDSDGKFTFSNGVNNEAIKKANASIVGDKINVTGFDFAENYVGTVTENGNVRYRGTKLVISFDVKLNDGFLGGNGVCTNGKESGIYASDTSTEPLITFKQPTVNVPIKNITVTTPDENVYLLNNLTTEQIKKDATVKVGDVELKLNENNYGLQPWQTEYVTIDTAITRTDNDKNEITDSTELKEDGTYTVSVTVTPKPALSSEGTVAEEKNGENTSKINVFKPELTYNDGTVYYGDKVSTDFTNSNLKGVTWKHDGKTADTETMGNAPVLSYTYKAEGGVIANTDKSIYTINTKQDIPVDATVNISVKSDTGDTSYINVTPYTTFVHSACNPECGWNKIEAANGSPAFLLHVKTCSLTITKTGGASDEPYVFTILKDDKPYTETSIVGNNSVTISELPVGTYKIREDTGWSWRYKDKEVYDKEKVMLSKDHVKDEIKCTNTKDKNYWLNGFSEVIKNIFDSNN